MRLEILTRGASDSNPHSFLWEYDHWTNSPGEVVMATRDFLDDRPETASVFSVDQAIERSNLINQHGQLEKAMAMVGAWQLPDIYAGGNWTEKWVNPFGADAYRYTDCWVRCECGNIFTQPQPSDSEVESPIDGANVHDEGCKPYHRLETQANLIRKREETIKFMAKFGTTGLPVAKRMGMRSDHVTHLRNRLDLDADEMREEYQQYRAEGLVRLLRNEWSIGDVGRVYGICKGQVRKILKKRFDMTVTEIRELE